MPHPWEEIALQDYEAHMQLDSVKQLQTLNALMQRQLAAFPAETAMILGIAGGNGLEHIRPGQFRTVYGVDINSAYLRAVSERFADLGGVLQCICLDLARDAEKLPCAQLLIADLLIEYIGFSAFQRVLQKVQPAYVSCVIQVNADEAAWVSESPYLHAFDRLDEVHHQIDAASLSAVMEQAGYAAVLQETEPLPNGKALTRLDWSQKGNS